MHSLYACRPGLANAYVGGDRVAQSQYHAPPGMQRSNDAYFCQLVASYSMGISRSEFKELTLELTQFPTTPGMWAMVCSKDSFTIEINCIKIL